MIIGLLGRSRVGKDTAATVIIQALGQENAFIKRLSQPLKDAVKALYGFTNDQVEDAQKEIVDLRYGVTPRVCIQRLCDHIMHHNGTDFFSRQLYGYYDTHMAGRQHMIIPDVRYAHDIDEIHKRGGIVIKIERHMSVPCHIWENHIDLLKGDYVVVNDSDIDHFREHINQTLCNSGLA